MTKDPLVSIIIPTYNRAHLIGETLDSVLAQSYQNWECIVVDDGSNDNTSNLMVEYCAKDSRFQYHKRPMSRPKGANSCRNYGFELSNGEFVQWFDSDDIMYSELLKSKMDIFMSDKNTDFVVCGFKLLFKGNKSKDYLTRQVPNYLFGYIDDDIRLNGQNILWKKEMIKPYKWDTSLNKFQDLDFIFNALKRDKLKGASIDMILVNIRVGNYSISSNQSNSYNKDRLIVRKRMCVYALNNYKPERIKRLYHLYLFEIKNLISLKNYTICISEIISSKLIPLNVKGVLLNHLIIYALFGKGMSRLTNYLIKVST